MSLKEKAKILKEIDEMQYDYSGEELTEFFKILWVRLGDVEQELQQLHRLWSSVVPFLRLETNVELAPRVEEIEKMFTVLLK